MYTCKIFDNRIILSNVNPFFTSRTKSTSTILSSHSDYRTLINIPSPYGFNYQKGVSYELRYNTWIIAVNDSNSITAVQPIKGIQQLQHQDTISLQFNNHEHYVAMNE